MPKLKLLQFSLQNQEYSPILSTTVNEYIVEGAEDVKFLAINLGRKLS